MKRLVWRLAPEVVVFSLLGVSAGGCEPKNDVQAGPPELLSFSVIDNASGQPLELTSDAGAITVPGFVHLSALFDRLLDPVPLANFDGGADQGSNVTMVTVAPALPGGLTVSYISSYTPNGGPVEIKPGSMVPGGLFFGPGPTLDTRPDPTFPSGSTITVTLDGTKVRSKKGEAFTGAGQLMFLTQPFAASFAVPMADPDPDAGADAGPPTVMPMMQPVTITFNNVVGSTIASHVHVTAGGAPFAAVSVDPSMDNPTVVTVTPTGSWPANSTIVVTVDATAADALGGATGAPASESFTTGGS
jgi:hypothetical protein